MSYTCTIDHNGHPVILEIEAQIHPGHPGSMNWGGLPSPPEPPSVEAHEVKLVDGQDLNPDVLWEEHEEELTEQILQEASDRYHDRI